MSSIIIRKDDGTSIDIGREGSEYGMDVDGQKVADRSLARLILLTACSSLDTFDRLSDQLT